MSFVFINLAVVHVWGHQTSSINRRCLHFYKIFLKATITEVRSENCTDSSFILRQSWGTFVFVVTVQRQNNLVFPDLPFQPNVSRSLPLGIFFFIVFCEFMHSYHYYDSQSQWTFKNKIIEDIFLHKSILLPPASVFWKYISVIDHAFFSNDFWLNLSCRKAKRSAADSHLSPGRH